MNTTDFQDGVIIREATQADLVYLQDIELAAGALFPTERIPADSAEFLDTTVIESSLAQHTLLVAEVEGKTVGFAVSLVVGQLLHLEEISVHPDYGRRGIGRTLMDAIIKLASKHSLESVVLTTFSDIKWNGPFYQSLGFKTYPASDTPQWLQNILGNEEAIGMTQRIAMHRPSCGRTDS